MVKHIRRMHRSLRTVAIAALALGAVLVLGACLAVASGWPARDVPTGVAGPPSARPPLPATRYRVVVRADLAYGPLRGEWLDLCSPRGTVGPRPGVLLIHGGGWVRGNKAAYDSLCRYLAGQGFVVATAGYRLARADRPASRWPAQLVDVQLAVRWLRARSATLDMDPARLCAWGSSAGGHLAVFLGVLQTIHAGDEAGLLTDRSPAVACVIDEFGPTDLTTIPTLEHEIATLLGAAGAHRIAALRDASPLFSVSSGSAPMLIVQGTGDRTVSPGQSLELLRAQRQRGVPVIYIGYAGGHGFSGLTVGQHLTLEAQELAYLIAHDRRQRPGTEIRHTGVPGQAPARGLALLLIGNGAMHLAPRSHPTRTTSSYLLSRLTTVGASQRQASVQRLAAMSGTATPTLAAGVGPQSRWSAMRPQSQVHSYRSRSR